MRWAGLFSLTEQSFFVPLPHIDHFQYFSYNFSSYCGYVPVASDCKWTPPWRPFRLLQVSGSNNNAR